MRGDDWRDCMTRHAIEPDRPAVGPGEAGFTLIEMLIALTISVVLTAAVFGTFRLNSRVARVETAMTQMQQSVRAVHLEVGSRLRVAGRGGLFQGTPAKARPDLGAVIEIADNVTGAARDVLPTMANSPRAVEGTDILTVRGVFTTPIYQTFGNDESRSFLVLRDASGTVTGNPTLARSGQIQICNQSPSGFPQPLDPLREAITTGSQEALVLASNADAGDYGVVRIDTGSSLATSTLCNPADATAGVTLSFVVSGDGGRADQYRQLAASGLGLPSSLTSVSFAALLEEYKYFVRDVREVPGDNTTQLLPRFSRARLYPNTGAPWGVDAAVQADSAATDIADDLLDFQVSLGLDSNQGGGSIEDGSAAAQTLFESANGRGDDWLFNSSEDNPQDPVWARPGSAVLTSPWLKARLFYVRITTVGRAFQPELGYEAPVLTSLEDRTYDRSNPDDPDSSEQRQFRRWLLTTTIDLRNL